MQEWRAEMLPYSPVQTVLQSTFHSRKATTWEPGHQRCSIPCSVRQFPKNRAPLFSLVTWFAKRLNSSDHSFFASVSSIRSYFSANHFNSWGLQVGKGIWSTCLSCPSYQAAQLVLISLSLHRKCYMVFGLLSLHAFTLAL
jgi:hypothetical protein